MKNKLMLFVVLFFAGITLNAQEILIHGKITNDKGDPIDNVIIKQK